MSALRVERGVGGRKWGDWCRGLEGPERSGGGKKKKKNKIYFFIQELLFFFSPTTQQPRRHRRRQYTLLQCPNFRCTQPPQLQPRPPHTPF